MAQQYGPYVLQHEPGTARPFFMGGDGTSADIHAVYVLGCSADTLDRDDAGRGLNSMTLRWLPLPLMVLPLHDVQSDNDEAQQDHRVREGKHDP